VQALLYSLTGFLVFLGQCCCSRTPRALPPASLLERDVDCFSPVIACPYSFSFHFSVVWLITSLSGLREVICCTSLPGCLPSQPAVSSSSSVSPSEVCSPSPAPPQPFPCPGGRCAWGKTCLSQTCSRAAGGICTGLGPPGAGATQGRQREGGEGRGEAAFPAAAQGPGGSGKPASIWTHQAKQLCWVPYVGGARIHDIRAHLVYNKPPLPLAPAVCFSPSLIHHLSSLQRARRNGFHLLPEPPHRLLLRHP